MNKIRIGITAISLLLGISNAFSMKASYPGTYWTTVNNHNRYQYVFIIGLCHGTTTLCAIQYYTINNRETGMVYFNYLN